MSVHTEAARTNRIVVRLRVVGDDDHRGEKSGVGVPRRGSHNAQLPIWETELLVVVGAQAKALESALLIASCDRSRTATINQPLIKIAIE